MRQRRRERLLFSSGTRTENLFVASDLHSEVDASNFSFFRLLKAISDNASFLDLKAEYSVDLLGPQNIPLYNSYVERIALQKAVFLPVLAGEIFKLHYMEGGC